MKVKKIVLTLFLSVIAVILSVVALLNVNANKPTFASTITSPSGYTGKYFDFTGNKLATPKGFRIQQGVTGTPNTIEAFIKVPTTANEGSRYGVIIGNFVRGNASDSDCFDLEIYKNGNW